MRRVVLLDIGVAQSCRMAPVYTGISPSCSPDTSVTRPWCNQTLALYACIPQGGMGKREAQHCSLRRWEQTDGDDRKCKYQAHRCWATVRMALGGEGQGGTHTMLQAGVKSSVAPLVTSSAANWSLSLSYSLLGF